MVNGLLGVNFHVFLCRPIRTLIGNLNSFLLEKSGIPNIPLSLTTPGQVICALDPCLELESVGGSIRSTCFTHYL